MIIPLIDWNLAPYNEPLGEQVLDKIYVRSIKDPEIIHLMEGIIQFEDTLSLSDTTSVACDNWAHATYEFIGKYLRGSVIMATKACLFKNLGGKKFPS